MLFTDKLTSRATRTVVAMLVAVAATAITLAPVGAIPGPPPPGISPAPPPGPGPGIGITGVLGKLTADDEAGFDYFGVSVSVSGDTVVVGSYGDDDDGADSGSAYVYTRSGLSWTQQAKLKSADAVMGDEFGRAVAIHGDTIVVGAAKDDDGGSASGSAYVFTRTGSTWSQQAKLTAADAGAGDVFGRSVAIFESTVVVGAELDNNVGVASGSAYVFTRTGAFWAQQAKLTASDGAAGDFFGSGVGVAGDSIVVGSPRDDDDADNSGSAYVFSRLGTIWSQQAKLTATDASTDDRLGHSVAISEDTVVAGAYGAQAHAGAAFVFTRTGTAWAQQTKLTASDPAPGDSFGRSVAISGDSIAVGALTDDDDGPGSGSAYRFTRSGAAWSQTDKFTAADGDSGDQLGISVAIDGIITAAGAHGDDDVPLNSGSAYMFVDTITDSDGDGTSDYVEINDGTDPMAPPQNGYWMLESDGTVYEFGDSGAYSAAEMSSGVAAIAFDRTGAGDGLWLLDSSGQVHVRGAAGFFGNVNTAALAPGDNVASISGTPTAQGYWVFTDKGQVLTFGDAVHYNDLPGLGVAPNGLIVASASTPTGAGYYLLGADGGVFAFGDATYFGSIPEVLPPGSLVCPIVGLVPTPSNDGYWMVACDGGVFAFGGAAFMGSVPGALAPGQQLNSPINGLVPYGAGYLMVAADGGVFTFSGLPFLGSLGATPPDSGIVAIAAFAS
jgi:FG-GAP repeat